MLFIQTFIMFGVRSLKFSFEVLVTPFILVILFILVTPCISY